MCALCGFLEKANEKWLSGTQPSPEKNQESRNLVTDLLGKLDKTKVAIVVAGTEVGGEGEIVIEEASKRGFDIIATPAEKAKPEDLSKKVSKFVPAGVDWSTRNHLFIDLLNVLITAGSTSTILNHIEITHKLKKPVYQLKGISPAIDGFITNLKPNIFVHQNNVDRIIDGTGLKTQALTGMCRESVKAK